MTRPNVCVIALIVCLIVSASSHGDTVSVSGVTARKSGGGRMGGVAVALADAREQGTQYAKDTSVNDPAGVYNLTCDGIAPTIDSLWVVCTDRALAADPVEASLPRGTGAIRSSKAPDLLVKPIGRNQRWTRADFDWSVLAIEKTEQILFNVRIIETREEAVNQAIERIRKIVVELPAELRNIEVITRALVRAAEDFPRQLAERPLLDADLAKNALVEGDRK